MTDRAALVEFCRALVRAPSHPKREGPAAEVLLAELRTLGFREVRVDRYGSAIGGDGPTIVLDGHLDTIELVDLRAWAHDPLGATLEDGAIHGLGAADMKAGLTAMNELSHRPNERVSIDDLEAAARGYAGLCEALLEHAGREAP
jgi:acetylornithine deacetylase/succinyl-diaminopimelate desuccinylase-like protein